MGLHRELGLKLNLALLFLRKKTFFKHISLNLRYLNSLEYSIMKKIALLFIVFAAILTSCDPFNTVIEKDSEQDAALFYESDVIKKPGNVPDTLMVATWNIKFGGGRIDFFFDCYGDRVLMKKDEVIANMKQVAQEVRHLNPDFLFVQEVDIQSKRSAYVDELQYILDHTDLNYAYYGSQWKADYVPSDGIGRMNSGSAILSKYPLKDAKRIPLSLIEEQSGIVQYFYLRRNMLKATAVIGNEELVVMTTHTSAYSSDGTRLKQLKEIKTELDAIAAKGQKFIIGGDFNTLPPNTIVYEKFDDGACDDDPDFATHSAKDELDYMKIFIDDFEPAISQSDYDADNTKYFSFTSDKNGFWNRKLDYIFTNGDFVDHSGLVHQDISSGGAETMPLSAHAPVTVKYILK